MALLLSTLRTFCAEQASPDSAGSTADREFMVWINGALYRLYDVSGWDRTMFQEQVTIPPRETGSDLNLTLGSLAITRDTEFPAKYVTDRWSLFVEGERIEFELAAVETPVPVGPPYGATLRAGDEWIKASATDQTYYFAKTKLPLPQVKEVTRVQVVNNGRDVAILTPTDFDFVKTTQPTLLVGFPTVCCWRRGRLEVWPHPGADYCKLGITYRRAHVTPLTTADAGSTEVAWDEELRGLLEKAILLEASIYLGEDAVVPYAVAKTEYEAALKAARSTSERPSQTGPMGLNLPYRGPRHNKLSWGGEIVDA